MLLKEYRVLLPLTVEEYKIAQLYMIAKKSRLDSSGAGHGVEYMVNKPFEDGPGGSGQYTYKIYHIGSRIPTWIRSVLPSAALEAHEEAWNAYPYTKTRYSCPMLDRFSVEVETKYVDDAGTIDNIFNLSGEDYKNRILDVLDFVKDPISAHDYCTEEDPKLYRSEKTGRGPLTDNWVEEHLKEGRPVMCAYKICRVEFRYWGLQTRAERWIHELALRGTMLRAHRQAWAWQDEWVGMTMEDIRRLEEETAQYLTSVMSATPALVDSVQEVTISSQSEVVENGGQQSDGSSEDARATDAEETEEETMRCTDDRLSTISEVFYDCCDQLPQPDSVVATPKFRPSALASQQHSQKTTLVRWSSELLVNDGCDGADSSSPQLTPKWLHNNQSLLILVFHADFFPKSAADSKITDTNTLRSTLDSLVTSHYPFLKARVHVLCVTCGSELGSTVSMLKGISPSFGAFHPSLGLLLASNQQLFNEAVRSTIINANRVVRNFMASETGRAFNGEIFAVGDCIGGILLYEALARSSHGRTPPFPISRNSSSVSAQSSPYLPSNSNNKENNHGNTSSRSLYNYPITSEDDPEVEEPSSAPVLHHKVHWDSSSNKDGSISSQQNLHLTRNMSAPPVCSNKRYSSSTEDFDEHHENTTFFTGPLLSFRPSAAFLFGCPLAQLLMQRKMAENKEQQLQIECDQLFNLYYSLDMCGSRLEPVLNPQLAYLSALTVPRYQRYPLGDGNSIYFDNAFETAMVWGNRRVDHELFCPQEMSSLPSMVLPNILHASYWESKDVSSFILRQFIRADDSSLFPRDLTSSGATNTPLEFQMPLAVWNKRRTRFKIANLAANHRANDLIVVEGFDQMLHARFCYGPMDLVVLSQESVLVYICPSGGEWFLKGVETTDKHGRLTVNLGKVLPIGVHSVRLIVQGDHSFLSMFIAVVPPNTPVVVFSIDGSLTGSMSVTGRDPRLRPGAVDVVRFWQQQGYMIIYLTARPDMQQRLVSAWLAQHNFPHGLLFFTPSFSTDPLRQKTQYMRHLVDIGLKVQAAYGSAKDIAVYASAGLEPEQTFKVGGHKRRGCVSLEDGYAQHLHDLHTGRVPFAQMVCTSPSQTGAFFSATSSPGNRPSDGGSTTRGILSRTLSFTPRTGKYASVVHSKKISTITTLTR